MPTGYRGHGFAVVTVLFIAAEVVLVSALAFSIGASHTERQLRAEHNSKQYSESTNDRIAASCAGLEGAALVECIRQEVEATSDHRRSEYDLSAQQDMADYAFWLVWISVATVAVTSLGVWFVKRTLDATFAAVEDTSAATNAMQEANAILREEQRPWIQFEILDFGLRHGHESDGSAFPWFTPTVKFKNWGRSPAFFVTLDIAIEYSDGFNMAMVAKFLAKRADNIMASSTTVFPGAEVILDQVGTSISDPALLQPDGEIPPSMAYLIVVATYRNGESQFVTTKVFMVHSSGLIPREKPGGFSPMHLMPFDRYE